MKFGNAAEPKLETTSMAFLFELVFCFVFRRFKLTAKINKSNLERKKQNHGGTGRGRAKHDYRYS